MAVLELLNSRLQAPYYNDFTGAEAVLGVQFNGWLCEREGAKPDPSNLLIAEHVFQCAEFTGLPVFVQTQHAVLLQRWGMSVAAEYKATSKDHVQTQMFLKWVARRVQEHGMGNKVVICGHGDHTWRIHVLARYYGLDPVFPASCADVPYANAVLPGDQFWCRTRSRFVAWEFAVARPATIALASIGKL